MTAQSQPRSTNLINCTSAVDKSPIHRTSLWMALRVP
jgi:hypothetical protein